jgi:hypothetical protein
MSLAGLTLTGFLQNEPDNAAVVLSQVKCDLVASTLQQTQ